MQTRLKANENDRRRMDLGMLLLREWCEFDQMCCFELATARVSPEIRSAQQILQVLGNQITGAPPP